MFWLHAGEMPISRLIFDFATIWVLRQNSEYCALPEGPAVL